MTISGLVKKITVAAVVLGALFLGSQKANAQETYLYWSLGMGINTSPNALINNIPEDIRNVPVHPDDIWAEKRAGPIKDNEFSPKIDIFSANTEFGIGIKKGRFGFEGGPKLSMSFTEESESSIVERNYTNYPGTDERGYGAALTYYKILAKNNSIYTPGISSRALYSISKKRLGSWRRVTGINLFAEYSFGWMFMPIYVETGWDRYDELEERKEHKLSARSLEHMIKLGCEFVLEEVSSVRAYVGVRLPQEIKNPGDNVAGLSMSPSVTLGTDLRVNLRDLKQAIAK